MDKKAPLSDFYSPDVIDALKNTMATLDRWALPQGQGKLLGATQGQFVVPKAINSATGGQKTRRAGRPAGAAGRAVRRSLK